MTRGERIALAISRKGLRQEAVAEKLGVDQTIISKLTRDVIPGDKHLHALAKLLDVPFEWLTVGFPVPEWVPPEAGEAEKRVAAYRMGIEGATLSLVGVVAAGDESEVGEWIETPPTPFPLRDTYRIVQVQGWSAYPVVYPDQFVITDGSRATRPDIMTDAQRDDLHDNLVICQVGEAPVHAYLKRFCHAPGAAGGFLLASVDSGRSSPFIEPREIIVIEPVVGVLFEDPRVPRKKRGKISRKDRL